MADKTCIVYLFERTDDMAKDDKELRYSLRALEKNWAEDFDLWIVGTKPDWYTGNNLPSPIYAPGKWMPRQDHWKKHLSIIASDYIPDTYVRFVDDIYTMRPVTTKEIWRPFVDGECPKEWLQPGYSCQFFRNCLITTFNTLKANNKPLYLFSNHLPHVFEKKNG